MKYRSFTRLLTRPLNHRAPTSRFRSRPRSEKSALLFPSRCPSWVIFDRTHKVCLSVHFRFAPRADIPPAAAFMSSRPSQLPAPTHFTGFGWNISQAIDLNQRRLRGEKDGCLHAHAELDGGAPIAPVFNFAPQKDRPPLRAAQVREENCGTRTPSVSRNFVYTKLGCDGNRKAPRVRRAF